MIYRFGIVSNVVLLGGGPIMVKLIQSSSIPVEYTVFTAERFLKDKVLDSDLTFQQFLEQKKINYFISENINSDSNINEFIGPSTLGVSISAPWIIKKPFISKFSNRKLINLHTSFLPDYRGGGGPSWKILNRENTGAYTIHFITPGIDDGDIILNKRYNYPAECINPENWDNYDVIESVNGLSDLFSRILKNDNFELISQNENESVYLPRLNTKQQAFINWNWSREDIVSFVNAFSFPHEGAKSYCNGLKIRFMSAQLGLSRYYHPFLQGLVIRLIEGKVIVAHTQGELVFENLVSESESFKISLGDRFVTPMIDLENALDYRAIYNSKGLKERDEG